MIKDQQNKTLIAVENLHAFFYQLVSKAIQKLELNVSDHTEYYLVNLLTKYSKSEALYGEHSTEDRDEPLVLILKRALEEDIHQKIQLLQSIGDKSLYTAGVFSESLVRKSVSINYYIGMGENAYGRLTHIMKNHHKGETFKNIYKELATKFTQFVDLFSEISDKWVPKSNLNLLEIYKRWLKTQNPRLAKKLIDEGLIPIIPSVKPIKH